jgi:segregation and condensation protein B
MEKDKASGAIEALLFVSGEAMPVEDLAVLLEMDFLATNLLIDEMMEEKAKSGSGIQIMRIEDKVQLCTNRDYAPYIQKMALPEKAQNLSQAILETLSIIAYKQPVTKSEIEAIRGVRCEYSVATLLERGMIVVAGKKDTIGRPLLYATNDEFLRHFGLSSLQDLPVLDEEEEQEA